MVYKDDKHSFMQAMKKKFEEAPDKNKQNSMFTVDTNKTREK